MKISLMAAVAAFLFWTSVAFGQTSGTWPTAETPCSEVLHPTARPNLSEANALIERGRTALTGLSDTAMDASAMASRDGVRATFQRAHELSGGSLEVVYSHAQALRRLRHREVALHIFTCLQTAPGFTALALPMRNATASSITALQQDIEAARPAVAVQPVVVVRSTVPVVAVPVARTPQPRATLPTPHPRSVALRTVGQVTTSLGVATAIAGGVLTAMCAADAFGDTAYLNEANVGLHGWSSGRESRARTLCAAGPIVLGVGLGVGAAGATMWLVGGRSVTDAPSDVRPPPLGTNMIPILAFAPTLGGGQALATWRF